MTTAITRYDVETTPANLINVSCLGLFFTGGHALVDGLKADGSICACGSHRYGTWNTTAFTELTQRVPFHGTVIVSVNIPFGKAVELRTNLLHLLRPKLGKIVILGNPLGDPAQREHVIRFGAVGMTVYILTSDYCAGIERLTASTYVEDSLLRLADATRLPYLSATGLREFLSAEGIVCAFERILLLEYHNAQPASSEMLRLCCTHFRCRGLNC